MVIPLHLQPGILCLYCTIVVETSLDLKHFIDITLLLAPVSIRNLNLVPLTDAWANQALPEFIFSKTTSALGLEWIV